MLGTESSRHEDRILTGIFWAALFCSLYGVTYHWTMSFMSGHEFRQAQTAINAYYIDEQNNFSLLYETPILGKPWVSILMEVPVYEWTVVLLSRATGLPHFMAARTISATCFYLALPAVYLLLGRFALPRPRRLLILALILVCPLYIYYTRAFLIDAMELMCCAWFLFGFVRTMDERRWSWLALTVVAGTGAALIKSAMLAVWLLPAAGYGAWQLWRDLRAGSGWRAPVQTLLWGAATVAVALGLLRLWIRYTDPIKAAHASAWIFTSANLSVGNWGLFDFKSVFSSGVWRLLLGGWRLGIMPPWLIGLGLVSGIVFLKSARWRVLGLAAVFFLAQLLFPYAYAYQDYYYYSCAVFLLAALGFVLLGLLDSGLPRWGCWLAVAVPFGAQLTTYGLGYYQEQRVVHNGGFPFTEALRDLTPKRSVIVVAGADWAAMTPLYAQRKALMIRNGLENDRTYLQRAFDDLAGEDVCALVLYGETRKNRALIEQAAARFDFEASVPTFNYKEIADIYVSRLYLKGVQLRLKISRRYPDLTIPTPPTPALEMSAKTLIQISPEAARDAFTNIIPGPFQANFEFGVDWIEHGNLAVLSAHPNADLWLRPEADAREILWDYGIFAGAYETPGRMTNGVEFIVEGERPDGHHRRLYYRILDPAKNPKDRGDQHAVIPYAPQPDEVLRFSTRPNENSAFDWAYWIRIKVR